MVYDHVDHEDFVSNNLVFILHMEVCSLDKYKTHTLEILKPSWRDVDRRHFKVVDNQTRYWNAFGTKDNCQWHDRDSPKNNNSNILATFWTIWAKSKPNDHAVTGHHFRLSVDFVWLVVNVTIHISLYLDYYGTDVNQIVTKIIN